MLQPKACHQGLRPRTRLWGLEPVDCLLLFPALYVCVVFLKQPLLGALVTIMSALVLRIVKWGRLPGYTLSLGLCLVLSEHHAALGRDDAPLWKSNHA